ncbi:hypothetical protein QO239_28515 [Cupriavidus taiwanensis]|uniref:hypothetical protein n=1 Tax=Cupriavidus taiwanensis TaxID=164546 RepID=UPI0015716153|nr:hypothetical protein [Cupriavidus taiwanensis]MDK3026557.1 hypothetical protein [Cupriavidus taiwanensis]NSX15360.1 hypothetical protein [Cupriavidus taiwanensis]
MTRPAPTGHRPRPRASLRALLAVATAASAALLALSACQAQPKASAPPPGSITDDRALGDIMVRFKPPAVDMSEDAGKLLAEIKGPIRYVVKRPMSGGVWLVTAISPSADATLDQAVDTLRATPRIDTAEPDRLLKPSRNIPTSRDMPAR